MQLNGPAVRCMAPLTSPQAQKPTSPLCLPNSQLPKQTKIPGQETKAEDPRVIAPLKVYATMRGN